MKNIDNIAKLFLDLAANSELTLEELAAVQHYVLKQSLNTPEARSFIKKTYNKDVKDLNAEDIAKIQASLVYSLAAKSK